MKTTERIIATACGCLLVGFACWLVGCRPTTPSAFGSRGTSWVRTEAGRKSVPGIDEVSIHFGVWGDGATIVVWSDGTGGSFGSRGMGGVPLQAGETRRGVKYEGHLSGRDGRIVNVECYTPDGKTGTVKIGDEAYELAQGTLFLISTSGAKPKVKQLKSDKLDLKPMGSRTVDEITSQTLEALAKTDPDIRAFFIGATKSE